MLEMPHSVQWLTPTPLNSVVSNSVTPFEKPLSELAPLYLEHLRLLILVIITGLKRQ